MSRAKLMTDAIDAFVVGCKADGIWDSIKACCILAGWDGLAGALTPIKGAAPTNVNFVAGDYNRKMGLTGNGSTKYLNTNRLGTADGQNDYHISTYIRETNSPAVQYATLFGHGSFGVNGTVRMATDFSTIQHYSRTAGFSAVSNAHSLGMLGHYRSSSTAFSAYKSGTTTPFTVGSPPALAINSFVFANNNSGVTDGYFGGRLAFYSIGSSIDLALLDTRVSTLLTSIWRAVHPEFTVVTNPDAMDWIGRVYDAGGSVSISTANAVNTFCNSIDAAGIRSKFLRLGIFAGNDLTSALVPLYRSSAYGGAVVGNATDTNNNFVSGDYVETGASGGLLGNGTTKYLNTGVTVSAMTDSNHHLSVSLSGANDSRVPIGADTFGSATSPRTLYFIQDYAGAGVAYYAGTATAAQGTRGNPAVLLGTRSATAAKLYSNGSEIGTATIAGSTAAGVTLPFFVFANNVNGTAATFYTRTIRSYSLGLGMTASEATAYTTAMQALQSSLGRQV